MKEIKKKALFLSPLLLFVIITFFFYKKTDDDLDTQFSQVNANDSQTDDTSNEPDEKETDETAIVDIKGAVEQPGIYEITSDMRVDDVLDMAGGFTSSANTLSVNLAEKVYDEMVIVVPEDGEDTQASSPDGQSAKVRINQASQEEIESLTGIGPSKAEAIIQYRDENGPFKTAEDLLDVSGIGEQTLESFREDILVP